MPAATKEHEKASGEKDAPKGDKKNGGPTKMGWGTFEQPSAGIMGEQEGRYATPEQACKGEHPGTNKPVFTGMGTLDRTQSPSREGFLEITLGHDLGEECQPKGNLGEADLAADAGHAKKSDKDDEDSDLHKAKKK